MNLTPDQIMNYAQLLVQAEAMGERIYHGVKDVLHRNLSADELQAVFTQWDENAKRAAANAGIDPA